ncbi:YecA family protein [Stenotrophomonas geniculata]
MATTYFSRLDRDPLSSPSLDQCKRSIDRARSRSQHAPDAFLDDLYVLDRCLDLIQAYARTWNLISRGKCSESWAPLQDCLDLLRLIKRFSLVDVSFFERQLIELEKAYPYDVFFSMGAVVEYFRCSICDQDIDSPTCQHRRGLLYRGKMARGIATGSIELDHISIVENPMDKRCVPTYSDDVPGFSLVRAIGNAISSGHARISQFTGIEFLTRSTPKSQLGKHARNERCPCNSGVKFKRCCQGKEFVNTDHALIVFSERSNAVQPHMESTQEK